MYDPEYDGPDIPVTAGFSKTSNMSKAALKHARALYAGEVTLVDRWFGNLFEKIEDLGLLENTAVIFTSDHGTFLGEHGFIHKYNLLYEEIAHIPLIIRLPETYSSTPKRYDGFVQPPDLMPTILELANSKTPPVVQGKSIIPLISGERSNEREIAVSSASLRNPRMSPWTTITSKDWTLIAANPEAPDTDPWTQKKVESELYHLPSDPGQTRNIINEKPQVAEGLNSSLIKFLKSVQTSEEIVERFIK
jgi:arylsulfatase A-like enzyme